MKKFVKLSAALGASILLACTGAAEERHLGDLIYVPAMTVQAQSGTHMLRVEGLSHQSGSDEALVLPQLAGAEFGVYVFSSEGELTPWANPLYPSEPMRIRTREGETRFALPQGPEFYLKQENAPQGYRFDAEALIPVTGEEIVVRNAMAGELVVKAVDTLGNPVPGMRFCVEDEQGIAQELIADENGEAVLACESSGVYSVSEGMLPEGVFAAISMDAARPEDVVDQDGAVMSVSVREASRTRVTFEHPASGGVQLNMQRAVIDHNGQIVFEPLSGVVMNILGEKHTSIVTDAAGSAYASLLEGEYSVVFEYTGDAILPVSEGRMIVESGATTVIDLTATENTGRMLLTAVASKTVMGGSVTLHCDATGESYGPYAFDGEGVAVSEPLAPGVYYVQAAAPEHTQIGEMRCGETSAFRGDELEVHIRAGSVTEVSIQLLTEEKQAFTVLSAQVSEQGETVETEITAAKMLQLISSEGEILADVENENGVVTLEALTGEYVLGMEKKDADKLGVLPQSRVFSLPSLSEHIVFPSSAARLILTSVDDHGMPVAYASYEVTDADGKRCEVTTDENGEAVTPLLAAGSVTIKTLEAPESHDAAPDMVVSAEAGSAVQVKVEHERHGVVRFALQLQKINESGNTVLDALTSAAVEIYSIDSAEHLEAVLQVQEDGQASCALRAGEYMAVLNPDRSGVRAGESVRFAVANGEELNVTLLGYDELGGLTVRLTGGELTQEEMAQVRFELTDSDGQSVSLRRSGDVFLATGLRAGMYTLSQTQMPQEYTLGAERTVKIAGGEMAVQNMPLEEYAVLAVNKTGLTFNDRMQTFVVPLTGQYALYTLESGEMKPYPSEEAQMTVWSNVTPEQIQQGMNASVRLPAAVDGSTYYVRETGAALGFAQDESYREIVLRAGETYTLESTVSSDRGFFSLEQKNAVTGEHVTGGEFELLDGKTMETVLSFELGEEAYLNPMAIPVGSYVLRQTKAAPGFAISEAGLTEVVIEPYLTQGGFITEAVSYCAAIPEGGQMDAIDDLYAVHEQGLTLVCVEAGRLDAGETLILPQMTLYVGAAGNERTDIKSVQLSGSGDGRNGEYLARVEYCLADGGWQPSDARLSAALDAPVSVSLADITDDISAVRITYLNAETGEELVHGGFTPGMVTVNVHAGADGDVNMQAKAEFSGRFAYKETHDGEMMTIDRADNREISFAAQGNGAFSTAPAGRDGRISGVAFFDTDGDGVMDLHETSRYAGMNVSLRSDSGEVIAACRTDGQGAYSFGSLSAGTYTVEFEAGQDVVFSSGTLYSEHKISSISDTRYGETEQIIIDASRTDHVIHAGCLFASSLTGVIVEKTQDGQDAGFGGLTVELSRIGADANEEPVVVVTGDAGEFTIGGILPGRYTARIELPQGYLCEEADDGAVMRELQFSQGEKLAFGIVRMERGASVGGCIRIDEDGDGVIPEEAKPLDGVRVKLLRVTDQHTEVVLETVTDDAGTYAFDMLPSGKYSVLFELADTWAFTRYGEDSLVYGSAAASGSTESFDVLPGQAVAGVNAGATIPASLTVAVFKDTQVDGQKGTYEEMLANASVSLIRVENGVDVQKHTAVTGSDGLAVFENVSPGEYVLGYQMPGTWRATKQVEASSTNYPVSCVPQSTLSTGRSNIFTLSMGQKDAKLYIGAMLSGSISGVVYYDDDADAQMNQTESGAGDLLVELLDSEGDVRAQMNTDAAGVYCFEGLAPGRYRVRFTAPQGCGFAATERTVTRGGAQESDSNVTETKYISIASGDAVTTADAGIVRLGALSGRIWEDRNADKAADEQELMLPGVEVALMNGSGRSILTSTVTDENGEFAFDNVRPGEYMLRISAPDGYVFSGAEAGSLLPVGEIRENRAYSSSFALLGGARVEGIGFGLFTQGTISGRVWQDDDFDAAASAEEAGLRGAQLTLLNAHGVAVAAETSQRSGEFRFDGLMPGKYMLQAVLPEGYVFTRDGGESVAAATGENTALIDLGELQMGQTIGGQMLGALKPSQVGGVVWMDQDDDGRRQSSDEGMQRVCVRLMSEENGQAETVYTDEAGAYRFEGVLPGRYTLSYELPQGYAFARNASGTKRVSCVPMADAQINQSAVFQVASDASLLDMDAGVVGVGTLTGFVWEDSKYDGRFAGGEKGVENALIELVDAKTDVTVAQTVSDAKGEYSVDYLRAGEYTVRVTLPDGMVFTCVGESAIAALDNTVGSTESITVAMGESISDLTVGAIVPASVSGRIYVDADENGLEDAQDSPLSGAMLTLMQGGTVVATSETDDSGMYAFGAIRPDKYRIRVTLPDHTLFARDSVLSLAHPDAVEGETRSFELEMGDTVALESIGTVRAASISGCAWSDENANGRMDAHEPALHGTVAELISLNEYGDASVAAAVTVDEDGRYAFGLLRSGEYAVRFTLPEGRLFADALGEVDTSSVEVIPGNVGVTAPMKLSMGEARHTVNVGGILPGSIGDTVWLDQNGNGLQDYREPLIPDVPLSLLKVAADGNLELVAETVSDVYGYYRFKDLRPGAYVIRVGVSEGDSLTHVFGAPLGEIDSDFDPDTAQTDVISLMSGQTLRNIDAGFAEMAN